MEDLNLNLNLKLYVALDARRQKYIIKMSFKKKKTQLNSHKSYFGTCTNINILIFTGVSHLSMQCCPRVVKDSNAGIWIFPFAWKSNTLFWRTLNFRLIVSHLCRINSGLLIDLSLLSTVSIREEWLCKCICSVAPLKHGPPAPLLASAASTGDTMAIDTTWKR